ncbi:hypothetical protein KKH43_02480 [Patescibacteria group bacterium]|nr:hypothetical protein [Patescibacteria group bacterium]
MKVNFKRMFQVLSVFFTLLILGYAGVYTINYFGFLGFKVITYSPDYYFLNGNSSLDVSKSGGKTYLEFVKNELDFNLNKKFKEAYLEVKTDMPNEVFQVEQLTDKGKEMDSIILGGEYISNTQFRRIQNGENIFYTLDKDLNVNDKTFSDLITESLKGQQDIALTRPISENDINLMAYKPSDKKTFYNLFLRGHHKLLVYVKDEVLDFVFNYYDINRKEGPDRFNIILKKNGVFKGIVQEDDREIKNQQNVHISVPDLEEGIYELDIDISDDLIISGIETSQSEFVFKDNFFPVENIEYSSIPQIINNKESSFFTNSDFFWLKTLHENGVQKVEVNSHVFDLKEYPKKYLFYDYLNYSECNDFKEENSVFCFLPSNDLNEIVLEKQNVFLDLDGKYLALGNNALIHALNWREINFANFKEAKTIITKPSQGFSKNKEGYIVWNIFNVNDAGKLKYRFSSVDEKRTRVKSIRFVFYNPDSIFYRTYKKLFLHDE